MKSETIKIGIDYVAPEELIPYANNARRHGEEDVDAIMKSIEAFGFNDPIGVWKNIIVEGHGRLIAAKRLGLETVPVIRLDHLTDEERKAYALAHNKTAELSGWNFDVLDEEIKGIAEFDMSEFGFDVEALTNETEAVDDEYEPKEVEEPVAQSGQVWILGEHRLMCGDSADPEDIKKLMGGRGSIWSSQTRHTE